MIEWGFVFERMIVLNNLEKISGVSERYNIFYVGVCEVGFVWVKCNSLLGF